MEIGALIKSARIQKDMSAKELAGSIGVTQSFMSALEKDNKKCSLETLEKICYALGMSIVEFFSLGDNKQVEFIPQDLRQFVLMPENHDILRLVSSLRVMGYSNDVLNEWLVSLCYAMETIKAKTGIMWDTESHADEVIEQERQRIMQKVASKLNNPAFKRPWDK